MRNAEKWRPLREERGPSELWGVVTVGEGGAPGKVILTPSTKLDGEDADIICRSHNARLERGGDGVIHHNPIVSHRTGRPAYQFMLGDVSWEWDLPQLTAFIQEMYELREAAITDSFIVRWVQERLMPDKPEEEQRRIIAGMFTEFRQFRDLLRNPVEEADEGAAPS